MACGTPVITSTNSSLPEIADNAALLINPHSTEDLANAIELLINNTKLQISLTNRGLERVKAFNWTNAAKEYINIFNK